MDIFNLAIEMEREGEKFYLDQEANTDNYGIKAVCSLLAKEEAKHAEIIKGRIEGKEVDLKKSD